jgi:hypothetical protein
MNAETVAVIVAVLVAVGAFVAWRIARGRRPDEVPTQPSVQDLDTPKEAVVAEPPPVPVAPPRAAPPHVAPVPPPPAPARPPAEPSAPARAAPAPSPLPPSIVPPTVITAPPAPRPAPPVIERVLSLDTATEAEWEVATPVALSAAQAASVATALGAERHPSVLAVRFAPGTAIAVARGDQAVMRRLADGGTARRWLDGTTSTLIAATALASDADERFLAALGTEMRELKAMLAGLPAKLANAGNGRLKPLVQDLARFAREAHDNFASAVGKAAFRERVEEAGGRAIDIWRELVERTGAARQQLDALSRTSRFGEAQVEKALAQVRDLQDQERLQDIAGRAVAASQVLRLAVGEAPGGAAAETLASTLAALEAGLALDRSVGIRLVEAEKAAKGDPYVGRAEFEANRAALRKLLERFVGPPPMLALQRLEAAKVAEALDAEGSSPRRLLVRNGVGVCAMRWSVGG